VIVGLDMMKDQRDAWIMLSIYTDSQVACVLEPEGYLGKIA